MKWFQHLSTANTDFALREIIEEFDGEGYGLYWLCIELVAQQGHNCRLKASKNWQKQLFSILHIKQDRATAILSRMAELNLIDSKALNKGDLFVPKMRRYSDDYTDRVRRCTNRSVQCTTKSPILDNNTIDKNTIDNTPNHSLNKLYKESKEVLKEHLKMPNL